ncbi:sigma-54 interaction domain-containing protein [Candidatus Formimonas warabiya]|uniref:HTH-type transcriptional regulatory protein TyrR n=1 Tax=Formimonas warabiya TaxID=1761012 RepID=A0A3G1KVE0_FORW1|nr:sigma 54-interacting transcriptional regulator [Candidatus Formimonas warabiya]ATW26448.1 hypothetical protein DCMF_18340 [Candidatus Formimonas warabiya]
MSVVRWKFETENRIGMITEVARAFSERMIPVFVMEVYPGEIYVKFELDERWDALALKENMRQMKDVNQIFDIEVLPQEQKENELQVILQSVSEGIVAIDHSGVIRYINPHGAGLFLLDAAQMVGKKIAEAVSADCPILNILKTGDPFDNKEVLVDTPRGRLHYLTTGRPLKNENNKIIGAVATLRSMKAARQLVNQLTKSQMIEFEEIIHRSRVVEDVICMAKKVAKSNYTILIRGESGTGKELFARAIHSTSDRRDKPFLPINCAALPETLLESELFGYEEGAFSGAKKGGKMGLFEAANDGTLFLDEIGELSLVLQSKLLRVLQDGVIRRVGGQKIIPINVRIIAATNRNLEHMVGENKFRQDLYYRINVIPLFIPPLRDRPEDIPLLCGYFLDKYGMEMGKKLYFSKETESIMISHSWPGNVREMQNVILRAAHIVMGNEIGAHDLFFGENFPIQPNGAVFPENRNLKQAKDQIERIELEKSLRKFGSARGAAKELGISHTAVLRKIRRYHLEDLIK